jgi:hypothetical protein
MSSAPLPTLFSGNVVRSMDYPLATDHFCWLFSLIFSNLRYYLRSSLSPVQGAVGRTGEGAGATEPPARTGRHLLLPRMQQKCALDLPRDECFTTLHSPAHIKFWGVKQCPLADEALDRLANAHGAIRILNMPTSFYSIILCGRCCGGSFQADRWREGVQK